MSSFVSAQPWISDHSEAVDNKAAYMYLFKNGDYSVFETMPVKDFKQLIEWKIKLEEEKQKQLEQMKQEKVNSSASGRQYRRK